MAPATVGWLGAVAIPAPGSAAVLPHEDTFPVAVEGRRALLAATATDLEPIVLAHDADPEIAELTAAAAEGETTLEVTDDDGVRHQLRRVTDADLLASLEAAFARTGAVIADGHHRFAAARAHAAAQPPVPGSDAILALVTPMGPGGLRVDAIHRVVPELDLETAVAEAARGFTTEDLPVEGPAGVGAEIARWLADEGRAEFLLTDGRRLVRLSSPTPELLADGARGGPTGLARSGRRARPPRAARRPLASPGRPGVGADRAQRRGGSPDRGGTRGRRRPAAGPLPRGRRGGRPRRRPDAPEVDAVRARSRAPGWRCGRCTTDAAGPYSPVLPSTDSRMRSACPLCRAYSSIM